MHVVLIVNIRQMNFYNQSDWNYTKYDIVTTITILTSLSMN